MIMVPVLNSVFVVMMMGEDENSLRGNVGDDGGKGDSDGYDGSHSDKSGWNTDENSGGSCDNNN